MHFDVRSRSFPVTDALQSFVARKARFSLGRFADRFTELTVLFEDVNGPGGQLYRACKITARAPGMVIRLEHRHPDAYAAAALVLGRFSRALSRRLGAARPNRRASIRYLPGAVS